MDEQEWWASLHRDGDGQSRPQRVCELSVQLSGVTGAGLSIISDSGVRGIVAATDDVAARIEDLQLTLGEGPCVDAVTGGGPVLVPDLDAPDGVTVARWPAFLEAAARAEVRAVFAFPLRIGAIKLGALDLYRLSAGDLTDEQLTGALWAADAAALAVLEIEVGLDGSSQPDEGSASAYQLQIHQATGMVKSQLRVGIDQAFLVLRAHAFSTGRPLIDVADDVVQRRLRFSPEDNA